MRDTAERSPELKALMKQTHKIRLYNGGITNAKQFKKCVEIIISRPELIVAFDLKVWLGPESCDK